MLIVWYLTFDGRKCYKWSGIRVDHAAAVIPLDELYQGGSRGTMTMAHRSALVEVRGGFQPENRASY